MIPLVLFFVMGVFSQQAFTESIGNSVDVDPRIFEDQIKDVFDGIINDLPEDPEKFDFISIASEDKVLNGTLELSNLIIDGLKSTKLVTGTLTPIGVKANITINLPKLTVSANHKGDFIVLDVLPLYGEGTLNVDFENLTILIYTGVDLSDGLQLKDFVIDIVFDSFVFDITGLLYDEETSKTVSSLIETILQLHSEVSAVISPIVQDLINGLLKTPSDPGTTLFEHLKTNHEVYKQALINMIQLLKNKV